MLSRDQMTHRAGPDVVLKSGFIVGKDARATKRVKLMLEAAERGEPLDANDPGILSATVDLKPPSCVRLFGMPSALYHAYPEVNHLNPFVQSDLPEALQAITPAHGNGIRNDGKVLPRQDHDHSVKCTTTLLRQLLLR